MKRKNCIECGAEFTAADHGHSRKYCSNTCSNAAHWRRKAERDGTYTGKKFPPRPVHGGCIECGASLEGRTRQTRYCSEECKRPTNAKRNRAYHVPAERAISICANPFCEEWFNSPINSTKETCGKDCSYVVSEWRKDGQAALESAAIHKGMLSACRIWYFNCCDCGTVIVRKWKRPGRFPCCRLCARRRYLEHNARKNHKRRAAGPKVMSVYQIAERDGSKCNICGRKVDMTLSGNAKWGPTIDHLIPVKPKSGPAGTNDPENLALAHRYCNTSRGNRGHAQLLMAV